MIPIFVIEESILICGPFPLERVLYEMFSSCFLFKTY